MRRCWTIAIATMLLAKPALGEVGGAAGDMLAAPLPAAPVGGVASRMFPHGHPLHICSDPDDEWSWLSGRASPSPWSSLTERSRGEANPRADWPAQSVPRH